MSVEGSSRRLEITDGLRAIAVLAVVLFHFLPGQIPGGFIGVDIFFVISGFVIAHRYLPALVGREVRMRDFFFRRIQRLAPVYLLAVAVTAAFAWFLLAPMQLQKFGQSLMAQAAYLQNVFFWIEGDYFEKGFQKPLLHTWSLAVEEQFYFLFPLLVLAFRRSRRLAIVLLALTFVGSLAAGVVAAGVSPKTAFYLLPMRVWQFVAGIFVAMAFGRRPFGRWATPLYLGGLLLTAASILAFGERAPFPGPQALLAVAGTVLICLVQQEVGPRAGWLLTNRVAQHFGRISYSWYLWHWPIVVFFHAAVGRLPGPAEAAGGILLSYLLAAASYRWLERPALAWPALRRARGALTLLFCLLTFCLVVGAVFHLTRGGLDRYAPAERVLHEAAMDRVPYRCPWLARAQALGSEACRLTEGAGAPILLIGDSHADRAKVLLSAMARARGRPLYLTVQNCSPVRYGGKGACAGKVWPTLARDIRRLGVQDIVVVSFNRPGMGADAYGAGLDKILATGVRVHVQRVVPNGDYFSPVLRARGKRFPVYGLAEYRRDNAGQDQALAVLKARYGDRLTILDPVPLLCAPDCAFDTGGRPNYLDTNHLNTVGMTRIAAIFTPVFATAPR